MQLFDGLWMSWHVDKASLDSTMDKVDNIMAGFKHAKSGRTDDTDRTCCSPRQMTSGTHTTGKIRAP